MDIREEKRFEIILRLVRLGLEDTYCFIFEDDELDLKKVDTVKKLVKKV